MNEMEETVEQTGIMYRRTEQAEKIYGPFNAREKALFWLAYSMARADADLQYFREKLEQKKAEE